MTVTKEKMDGDLRPAQVRLEVAAIALLVEKIASLDKEVKEDLMAVLMDVRTCTTAEELSEVECTIQELLFPELAGDLVVGEAGNGKGQNALQSWTEKVGERIRTIRESKRLTQDQLADLAGLRQSHISRLEGGLHSPSHKTLQAIALALGVNVGDIDPAAD